MRIGKENNKHRTKMIISDRMKRGNMAENGNV
jgi:hypothetical protein